MSALRNKCFSPLVNHVKHHTWGQLVSTQATTFLQGEDTEGTQCTQGRAWAVPSLPAQHILASLPTPLYLGLQASWAPCLPPQPLRETRSTFWLVTPLLQVPPQYLSLIGFSSLVLETRNLPNVAPASELGSRGTVVYKAVLGCRLIELLDSFIASALWVAISPLCLQAPRPRLPTFESCS